jgi:hypothetical protein
MKVLRSVPAPMASALGYMSLLLSFAALGPFVAALATGSRMAAILGTAVFACLAGSVLSFRAASRKLARSGVFVEATSPVSIFSKPVRRNQIERYLGTYRGEPSTVAPQRTLTVLVGGDSTRRTDAKPGAPARLSA